MTESGGDILHFEVVLPNGTIIHHENLASRTTADSIKAYIFKVESSLKGRNPTDFLFQVYPLENNEVITIEFVKILSSKTIMETVEKSEHIKLKLITRTEASRVRKQSNPPTLEISPLSSPDILQFEKLLSPENSPSRKSPKVSKLFKDSSKEDIKREKKSRKQKQLEESPSKGRTSKSSPAPLSPSTGRQRSATASPSRIKQLFSPSLSKNATTSKIEGVGTLELKEEVKQEEKKKEIKEDLATEEESPLIAPNQFAFHTEVGDKALSLERFLSNEFESEVPAQLNLYEIFFLNRDHVNYLGTDEKLGPVIISVIEEKELGATRCLFRTPAETEHLIEYSQGRSFSGAPLKVFLAKSKFDVNRKSLRKVKSSKLHKDINKFDESHLVRNYKFGVLYCKEGQTTEDEWFGNEHGSTDFDDFLDILGNRIELSGWGKFRGGLDVREGSTGTHSVFLEWKSHQIMYHVSTLLPYMEADEQKIERKRHIGNDIIVIIYMEGDMKFTPEICKSVFNHVYIVIRKDPNNEDCYLIGVTIKDGVKRFGPSFPFPPSIHKNQLRKFLVTKMLNGEWAAYRSLDFSHKFKRTRKMQLNTILKDYENES